MRRARLRHAVVLGLLQGPTELLPVSSSAHTTLIPRLAGWSHAELDPELRKSFEVALHAGAGAALAIDMRTELIGAARTLDKRRAAMIGGIVAIGGELDVDLVGLVDHVVVGDDVALGIDDEA